MAFAELPFFTVNYERGLTMCEHCGNPVDNSDICHDCTIQSFDHLQRARYYSNQERLTDMYDLSSMKDLCEYLEMKYHLD